MLTYQNKEVKIIEIIDTSKPSICIIEEVESKEQFKVYNCMIMDKED